MRRSKPVISALFLSLSSDLTLFMRSALRSRTALVAENLFLRKQLAFCREHKARPRPLTDAARLSLVFWSRLFEWKDALVIVKPETLIGWHRKGFKLFWRWKSRPGRPPLPREIRELIARMARENPTWGQVRVAAELSLKLGIQVSPRTVRKYWPDEPNDRGRRRASTQQWATFVRNHADALVACDFMVAGSARFQFLCVFVILELGSRRILQCNVTAHPTAEWTLQQLREAIPGERGYSFLIHDRDSIFSAELDEELTQGFGLRVLRTPPQSSQANAYCERLIGTMRREYLDFLILLSERHLRRLLRDWVHHYNYGRPHASLGLGIPDEGRSPAIRYSKVQSQIQEDFGTDGSPSSRWITPRVCLAETGGLETAHEKTDQPDQVTARLAHGGCTGREIARNSVES
jgi:putative transposase